MIGAQRAGAATVAGLMAAALSVAAAQPAEAAVTPGWRLVSTHRFGGPAEVSLLSSVVSAGRNSAWAFGGTDGFGPVSETPVAEHWNGRSWHVVALPCGGLWMNNFAISASVGPTVDHLSRAGKWRQYRVPRAGLMFSLAHIPGTASMWGTGVVYSGTGANAAIWAYGRVG